MTSEPHDQRTDAASLRPEDLRAFVDRDWNGPARVQRVSRADESVSSIAGQRLRVGDDLRAHAYRLHPHWPTRRMRREDFEHHLRWVRIMDQLRHL